MSDDLGIPAFLKREDTPESKRARERLTKQLLRRGQVRRVEKNGRSTISTGHAANLDEVGRALLKEISREKARKQKERFARLRELKKGPKVPKTGKKEQALRAAREETPPVSEGVTVEQSAELTAEKEKAVKPKKKTSKKASKHNARTPVRHNGHANGNGKSIRERIIELASHPHGCTNDEVFALTEKISGKRWPTVSMPQVAASQGVKLKIVKKKGEATRYFVAA